MVLNLKSPEDAAILRSLSTESDILVENFTPGVMERLGMSYEFLAEDNQRLGYAALHGFGDARSGTSPYQEWPAFDIVVQAMAGIVGITGTADGTPIKVGPGVGDIFPGTMLALGIASASTRLAPVASDSSWTWRCTTRHSRSASESFISFRLTGRCLGLKGTDTHC